MWLTQSVSCCSSPLSHFKPYCGHTHHSQKSGGRDHGKKGWGLAYLSPCLAVVSAHYWFPCNWAVPSLAIQKTAAEPGAVLDLVRTATPVPTHPFLFSSGRYGTDPTTPLQTPSTAALRHVALAAGACDGVDQPCRHHRLDKGRLSGACREGTKIGAGPIGGG